MGDDINEDTEKRPVLQIVLIILGAVFVLALVAGGLGYTLSHNGLQDAINNKSFEEGYNRGINDVLAYIAYSASQCNLLPINISGEITTIMDINCIDKINKQS